MHRSRAHPFPQALAILERYHIEVPANVRAWLEDPRSETLKPGDPMLSRSHFQLIATPQQSLDAAALWLLFCERDVLW